MYLNIPDGLCSNFSTAEEYEIWYRREVLKRVRQNAQRRLREIARAKDLKKIAKHKQRYVNLVAAIKPPSVIKDASRKEAMVAQVKPECLLASKTDGRARHATQFYPRYVFERFLGPVPGFLPADY